jgi:hypothetical protein
MYLKVSFIFCNQSNTSKYKVFKCELQLLLKKSTKNVVLFKEILNYSKWERKDNPLESSFLSHFE